MFSISVLQALKERTIIWRAYNYGISHGPIIKTVYECQEVS
jgi:hypothetical protein